jgi:hypothetical protein
MVELGTYGELLASSSSFRCLLKNIHQQEQEHQESQMSINQKRSSRCVTFAEKEGEEILSSSLVFEMKQEGSVKWGVYVSYMQAGVGLVFGIILTVLAFSFREGTSIFYSWWLAKWSDDQNHRYQSLNKCTGITNDSARLIRSMNDTTWNNYQRQKFNIYSGLFILYGTHPKKMFHSA